MGVGVSYSGVGGHRKFDLSGVPSGDVARTLGAHRHKKLVPESFMDALRPKPIDPAAQDKEGKVKLNALDMRPGTLDKKLMPGSAVVASHSGLCLEGEQQNPSIIGTKLYGSKDGKKGYYGIDEIDPPKTGARVGVLGEGGPQSDTSTAKMGEAFTYQVASRTAIEIDDLGRKILVEYDKDVQDTAGGRTHTVTEERRRIVGIINDKGVADFDHPFKVEFDKDHSEWIVYVPERALVKYSGSGTTEVLLSSGADRASNGKDRWYVIPGADVGPVYLTLLRETSAPGWVGFTITANKTPSSMLSIAEIVSSDTKNDFRVSQRVYSALAYYAADPEAFAFAPGATINDDAGEAAPSGHIVNCVFYWEGKMQELVDFSVSEALAEGSVYLCGIQPPVSEVSPNPEWIWSMATEEAEAPENGKVLNFKLYDFLDGKVAVDYRSSFLAMTDTTKKAKIDVGPTKEVTGICLDASKPVSVITVGGETEGESKIEISAGGGESGPASIVIRCGNGKIVLDAKEVAKLCDAPATISLRTMTVHSMDASGVLVDEIVHFLGCRDIELDIKIPVSPPGDGDGGDGDGGDGDGGDGSTEGGEGGEITIEKGEDTNLWVNGNVNGAVGKEFKIDVYYS